MFAAILPVFAVVLAGLTNAVDVCPDGQVALGFYNNTYAITANNCGVIDHIDQATSYCSPRYDSGSAVYCNGGTPYGVQTPDNTQWENCARVDEGCNLFTIQYCCSRLVHNTTSSASSSSSSSSSTISA